MKKSGKKKGKKKGKGQPKREEDEAPPPVPGVPEGKCPICLARDAGVTLPCGHSECQARPAATATSP